MRNGLGSSSQRPGRGWRVWRDRGFPLGSADQGASWELSPDEPVLVGVEAVAWVEGMWSLFTLDEETRTLQRWSSPDRGDLGCRLVQLCPGE